MRYIVKNNDLFLLPGNLHMLHLATIGYGLREFVVFVCIANPPHTLPGQSFLGKVYIEEATLESVNFSKDVFANLKFIADDNLANDLAKYAEMKGLLNVKEIMMKILTYPQYVNLRAKIFPHET